MKRLIFALAATGSVVSASVAAQGSAPPVARPPAASAVRQSFASSLSMRAVPSGPAAWRGAPAVSVWARIASLGPRDRQAARWDLVRSLIGENRGAEALGVLEVMRQDDPDLALVAAWRLAHAVALGETGRWTAALTALGDPALARNPEACVWRLRSASNAGFATQALSEIPCASAALAARPKVQRRPFALAAARAAVESGRPTEAGPWLRTLKATDPAANLFRGKAALALGQAGSGLDQVAKNGNSEQRIEAQLSLIEASVANRSLGRSKALAQLGHLRFVWRGGDIERRALRLDYQLSSEAGDMRGALAAGATLVRYFEGNVETSRLVASLQSSLASVVARDSVIPVEQAAGLYWDFRDLTPAGAAGDFLVANLADRLQAAGLYGRAGELLQYQLTARAWDIAQGPLSVKVATLQILAGFPERALRAIRDTDGNLYPPEMVQDRHRVEAVALHQLGKTDQALAALQDVPDGDLVRAEIFWKTRNWKELVSATGPILPPPGPLSTVAQAILLRHAIALAMLGREADLERLRTRYAPSFARLPTAATFDVLTHAVGSIDPTIVSQAMAALPSVSPAGPVGDLLDAGRPATPAPSSAARQSS